MITQQFTDVVAVASVSPGPIATNCAAFIGYKTGGLLGAMISTIGISLPSLFIILLLAVLFNKMKKNGIVQSVFYGLRPVITGLIAYAAANLAIQNNIIGFEMDGVGILILFISLILLFYTKTNPILIVLFSGIIGITIY